MQIHQKPQQKSETQEQVTGYIANRKPRVSKFHLYVLNCFIKREALSNIAV